MFPTESTFAEPAALQDGDQALAGERSEFAVVEGLGVFRAGEFQEGGQEIDHMADFCGQLAARGYPRRPSDD